ncbi:MAG: Holliday junction branch migration DNA helicase RuvB [Candidatus Dojkabacteria bacterium]|nr:Holliday junction branch migration DNA helicase RuvB [Candidatus Dojkabacteria bacterium]
MKTQGEKKGGNDSDLIKSLRPRKFSEMIGRKKEIKNLSIMLQAAQKREEALDHVLFYGPPGLGKTTLANVISNEMEVDMYVTSGPAIEKQGDLVSILTNITKHGILFIDEIHRLHRSIEEILYPAMEDKAVDIIIGKGPSARTLRLELEDFSLIGATTRIGLLSSPLRSRFGASFRLDYYSPEELSEMIIQASRTLGVKLDESGALEIAKRSRGTARTAIQHLKRVRDYVQVVNEQGITKDIVEKVLRMHEIDDFGLDYIDRRILKLIIDDFGGGPVGLSTISAALSEEVGTIADVYEPYLIQAGFLRRTPRGRIATNKALKHLMEKQVGSVSQANLFAKEK